MSRFVFQPVAADDVTEKTNEIRERLADLEGEYSEQVKLLGEQNDLLREHARQLAEENARYEAVLGRLSENNEELGRLIQQLLASVDVEMEEQTNV